MYELLETLRNHCYELAKESCLSIYWLGREQVSWERKGYGLIYDTNYNFDKEQVLVQATKMEGNQYVISHEMWIKSREELEALYQLETIEAQKEFVRTHGRQVAFPFESLLDLPLKTVRFNWNKMD